MSETVRVKVEDKWYTVEVGDLTRRPVTAVVDGYTIEVEVQDPVPQVVQRPPRSAPTPSPAPSRATPIPAPAAPPPVARPAGAVVEESPEAAKLFRAPMPGTILSIEVNPGDQVVTGDAICVLEAMKMQQMLYADWSGVVKTVMVTVGQQVMGGAPIVELE